MIEKAKSEDEVWKIVNKIAKSKDDKTWILKEGEEIITDEKEIADIFIKRLNKLSYHIISYHRKNTHMIMV